MSRRLVAKDLPWMLLVLALLAPAGCAATRRPAGPPGVPIEERPTPPQPPPDTTAVETPKPGATATEREAPPVPAPKESVTTPVPPVQTVMSAEERKASLQRIVADTTAASGAVKRCVGKTLLPDQESVYETTRSYLMQARAAIARVELWSAEGLARKARQLALSLECR